MQIARYAVDTKQVCTNVGIGGWHARLVSKGANDGAEDHGGAKAGDEEAANVAAVKAVVLVERIDIGALKPVAGCAHAKRVVSAQ